MLKLASKLSEQLNHITFISIGKLTKLRLIDAALLAYHSLPVSLSKDSYEAMSTTYHYLKKAVDSKKLIYGLNTNFGDQVNFVDPNINDVNDCYFESIIRRQENIIKSLSCSLGREVEPEIIRVTMMLRAHCLAQGYSGVHPDTVVKILSFLNAGIIPIVSCYGSIGASGDLIPLGSIAAGMMGYNVPVYYQNKKMLANEALVLAQLNKMKPTLRDGLAMINGTSFMTAITSIACYDLSRLFNQLLTAIAMALEAMTVQISAYDDTVHQVKLHSGQQRIAEFMRAFWHDSHLLHSSKHDVSINPRIQDYYSLRAVAQGFGPFYESLHLAIDWVENEMNSVNDNPIIDVDNDKILHSANFMGYYITSACDLIKLDIAQASTWIHALLANMVHARKSKGLPTNIVENPGINNGFRSMQLLAAAIAVQNRKLATGHQAYTLPTEGDNQDVNSLGTHAAFDLREAVQNLERLTAILLLASAQALELRGIENASKCAYQTYELIRQVSPKLTICRPMMDEIKAVITLLKNEVI